MSIQQQDEQAAVVVELDPDEVEVIRHAIHYLEGFGRTTGLLDDPRRSISDLRRVVVVLTALYRRVEETA